MPDHRLLGSLERPLPDRPVDEIAAVLDREFALRGELTPLAGEREQNLVLTAGSDRYVVKIIRLDGPADELEMQAAALSHIAAGRPGFAVPTPVPAAGGAVLVEAGGGHVVRVLGYVDGELLRDLPAGTVSPYQVGATVAAVQSSLRGFFHPAAGRRIPWDAREAPGLLDVLDAVPEEDVRGRVGDVLTRFAAGTARTLGRLPAQVVHNDLNPDNLVVVDGAIGGVIDFGDMVHGPRVMDLAVAAAYQLVEGTRPAEVLAEVVAGFETAAALTDEERTILPELIAVRLCQSIVIGAWHAARHPGNADYLLGDAASARRTLQALDGLAWPGPAADSSALKARRDRVIAPGLRLSYEHPIHLVSGEGVWLEDAAGRRYLDAYNNVAQVGHGHPLIAGVLARRAARLNTNTRYLTEELVEYAERLTALLPDGLDVCYLTNSGSEANDLAFRIARVVTGGEGVVVTDHAYHGSTSLMAALSPEELGDRPLPGWAATVPPPGGMEGPGAATALASLHDAGVAPAAVLFDTIFSSDGIHDPPAHFLDEAARAARRAGALYIADEVQAGLGRVGARFWGFAAGTAVPDIVTLGKPIGNGHPMGAVITTREIADRFAERDYFFSTFGGNTVSAAVGTTVLEITHRDRLAERAERVGAYIRSSIEALELPGIGAVRGAGLFIGVEVVTGEGDPDPIGAVALVEAMKQRGVLIGRTGRGDNVLKIRPPLVFAEEHADILLAALAGAAAGG